MRDAKPAASAPRASAPRPVWGIALVAMAPFPVSAVLYAYGPPQYAHAALGVLLSWSAVVLSFLGGVRWGMETARPIPRWTRLAASVVSPVGSWLLLLGRDSVQTHLLLLGLLAAFLAQWLFDHSAPDVPSRYPNLTTVLTLGACLSLAVALEQALRL